MQSSDLSLRVKRILEEETGNTYELKERGKLPHAESLLWYLHIPIGNPERYIGEAYQTNNTLILQSHAVFDTFNYLESHYPEDFYIKYADSIREDVDRIHTKDLRRKYQKLIPSITAFFGRLEELITAANRKHATDIKLFNDHGYISLRAEVDAKEAERNESLIRKSITAIKEIIDSFTRWMNQQKL